MYVCVPLLLVKSSVRPYLERWVYCVAKGKKTQWKFLSKVLAACYYS